MESIGKRRYWDVHNIAEVLGVSVATIYRWRSDGTPMPPAIKIGQAIRWRPETVEAWMADREGVANV